MYKKKTISVQNFFMIYPYKWQNVFARVIAYNVWTINLLSKWIF